MTTTTLSPATQSPDELAATLDEKGQAFFADHYTDPLIHLATAVYVGSLLRLKAYPFTTGTSEVMVTAGNYSPEYTPKAQKPNNELDALLLGHPQAFSQKVTFPFDFDMVLFRRALSVNKFTLMNKLALEDLHAYQSKINKVSGLMVELKSKLLDRSLYFDIFSSV